jgi:hypothetical protein
MDRHLAKSKCKPIVTSINVKKDPYIQVFPFQVFEMKPIMINNMTSKLIGTVINNNFAK